MSLIEKVPMPPLSAAAIEKKTLEYLKKYCSCHLSDPGTLTCFELLETIHTSHKYRLLTVEKFPDRRIEARTNFFTRTIEVTASFEERLLSGDGRSLFTLAHECSHVLFHSEYVINELQTAARTIDFGTREIKCFESSEWQAEHGGGALLMPIPTLIPLIRSCVEKSHHMETIIEIVSDTYGVTESAAKARINAVSKDNLKSCIGRMCG